MAPLGNKNAVGNRGGRPTKFKPEYCEMAKRFCMLKKDANDTDLASFFQVTSATISNWKNNYPEFLEALHSGKELADVEVVSALHQRAVGYSHPAQKFFYDQKEQIVVSADYVEQYPPSEGAIKLWLQNRYGSHWKDKVTIEIDDPKKVLSELLGIDPEEIGD